MRLSNIFLPLLLLLTSIQGFSMAKISGKVTDEKTGETIIGATVAIKGTTIGSVTNVDGQFSIPLTAAGIYTVEVKYIGYQTKEIEEVEIKAEQVTTLNIVITENDKTKLQEVVVHSSLKKENISALYAIQKNAASISDGISADVIKKSPDRNTGEVLKRVSGTTIQDNKFVIVRGLSERYNSAMVDNAILPSTEPNRKAFSFDIIPANLIDNIIITKAATPDLPADFAGGVINILTKEIPEKNFTNIAIGTSVNTLSTFKTFQTSPHSGMEFLGFDNSRKLPSNFPDKNAIDTRLLSSQQTINAEKELNNKYTIKDRTGMPGFNLQASSGRSWRFNNGGRFGTVASITYSHSETISGDDIRIFNNYDYNDAPYKYSSNLGALLNLGYSSNRNKIVLKTLYNNAYDDNFLYRNGYDHDREKYIKYYAFDLLQKSLFKTSLEGQHQIGNGQSKLNWLLSYNRVTNDQPDQRKASFSRDSANDIWIADNTTIGKSNNRLFSKLGENIYIASANYILPFNLFNNKSSFKVGALGQYRNRDFNARYIGLKLETGMPDYKTVSELPLQSLYADDIINKRYYSLEDNTGESDNYNATAITTAGYVMLDNKLADKFRIVWGVRVENYNLKLHSALSGNSLNIMDNWLDVLPSVNFTYALTERSNLRLSYYRTVARPELREIAPIAYYDYETNAIINGETTLKRTQIDNGDLRYELYPKAGEIISASVFYKHFNNTIENEVYSKGISQYEINPNNFPTGYSAGVEAEFRKNLSFLGASLKGFNFYANLAYIKSLVTYTDAEKFGPNGQQLATDRPLSGQSNYVVNSSLGYTTQNGKLSLNVLYNRIGQRIYLVGQGGGQLAVVNPGALGNVYEGARNLLDFQTSYSLSKKSELRLNIKDILNAPYLFYYDQNNNGKFDSPTYSKERIEPTQDYILQQYKPGTTFSLTYLYNF